MPPRYIFLNGTCDPIGVLDESTNNQIINKNYRLSGMIEKAIAKGYEVLETGAIGDGSIYAVLYLKDDDGTV